MRPKLHIDYETRSTVDLKKIGVYAYAEHPTTEVLCMAWAIDDGPVELWTPGMPLPEPILDQLHDLEIYAHNAQFERIIWWLNLSGRHGWPRPAREQFYCTAAMAAAMSLPRQLDQAAQVMGLDVAKDMEGHKLMLRMTKPRKPRKRDEDPKGIYWHETPEQLERLYEYCRNDVVVERELEKRLRPLSDYERRVYLQDQLMNDRGVMLDVPLIQAAREIVHEGQYRANKELAMLTDGQVTSATQVAQLKQWMNTYVELEDLQKETLRDLLGLDDLPEEVQRAALIRMESAKSSIAKLDKMLEVRSSDDRARGLLLYHGAGTGRWAGKLIQPQNFPRTAYWRGTQQIQIKDVHQYIPAVLAGDFDAVDADHPALVVISALLRGMLVAGPGHEFMAGDYSQIEARVLAWISEQDDLVEMFAQDAKIYEEMGGLIYGIPVESVEKDSIERQVGKNTVLGCGYQMGAETYQRQAKKQTGLDLPMDLCETAVKTYRERFGKIAAFWGAINRTAMRAVESPGKVFACGRDGKIRYVVLGGFLWCILPSGRTLAYANPKLAERVTPWGEKKIAVAFQSVNSRSRKWQWHTGYGGLWTENVVQAMARDIMAAAKLRLEGAGYRPILSVHDEVISEPPIGHGSVEEYRELMMRLPRWAVGLPVAVEAWKGARYRK